MDHNSNLKEFAGSSKAFVFDLFINSSPFFGVFFNHKRIGDIAAISSSRLERVPPGVDGSARLPKVLAPLTFVTPQVGLVWLAGTSERKQLTVGW